MPEGLQRAAPPPAQLLEVALAAAAAHSRAALQYSAAASNADGIQNREVALDMQDWVMQVCTINRAVPVLHKSALHDGQYRMLQLSSIAGTCCRNITKVHAGPCDVLIGIMQATATALQCAHQLQRHLGSPRLSARGAHLAAEALQHLAAAVQPGRKQQRGLAPRFATLAHNTCWAMDAMAAAPPQQVQLH